MSQQVIDELENSLEASQADIDRLEALKRLMKNPDYKLIIDEFYLKEQAIRLTMCLDDPGMKHLQDDVLNDLRAIAGFRRQLGVIFQMGEVATQAKADYQQELDEIRGEE